MLDFNTRKEGTAIPHRPMLHIGRCTLAATMEETHYRAKRMRPLGKRRVAALAAVIVLLLGIAAAGVQYFDFVFQTVYKESTAHLAEVLHQSNNMLNEVVEKNLTYLHMWETTMRHISDEDEIRQFIESVQQETGFSNFYFLSAEGNYMTAAGETGYLGIQDDLEDRITQGGDIVMSAVLPGKPEMLVFACPENQGTYRDFAYDAVAVSYYNDDIVKVLDISAFDGTASRYVLHPDGRIIINCAAQMEEDVYNLLAAMQERSPLTSEDIQTLSDDFTQGRSGSRLVTLDGTRYYMTYQSAHILDWTIVGLVPAAVVNAGMNALQSSTIVMVSMIVLGISALALALVHRKSSVKLRRKDMEILYRDELFMKLSMNVDDVFLMLDAQTDRADYVSPNVEKLLGITAEQIQEDVHVLGKLHPQESAEQTMNYLTGLAVNEQREWDFEYIHQKTGEHRWFHVIAMGSNVEGRTKYILVMSDRTADKKINQALSEAVRAAETANRAKSTFLSNMSHDIRTPMNAIIGFTTLAVSNMDDKERVQDYLSKILASGNHLLSLINDILDMSRIESGKIHLEETETNLSDVLHDLKTIVSGQIHAKQLELYMDAMDVTDEDVYCDKTRLNQVLLNLLSNAIKFTPAGGTVSVRLRQLPGTRKDREQYEIRVKDNGIGMSPEFAKKIFDPFERERSSTVSRIQGTGLGTAITKNIVDMMGGSIEIRIDPDKGTEFIIRVALRVQPEHHRAERIAELEGLKALVVDDDFNTCDSVTKMLVRVGMRSEWTLSGKEAVLRARQSMDLGDAFHAYIIDWCLPDMNGIEVIRQIRSLGDGTPIIILTAYDWADIEAEAKAAGVTAFCSKPMFMSDLRETLLTALGQSQTETDDSVLPGGSPDFRGKHILLAEDNELNREIAVEILSKYGFVVDTAENGVEAVKKIEESKPGDYDLVLMDVQMPLMDGGEATRQIRALPDPALAKIPILAMTANAFEEDRKSVLECGMNGFLSKPINIEELIAALSSLLAG